MKPEPLHPEQPFTCEICGSEIKLRLGVDEETGNKKEVSHEDLTECVRALVERVEELEGKCAK